MSPVSAMRPSSEVVQPEKVAEVDAHEGPVYVPEEEALYFTTLPVPGDDGPRVDIKRLALDSPNDVVVKSDGTIWFTDPSYGWLQGFRPRLLLRDAVRRYDPQTGQVTMVAKSLDKPNGLCFSPDESVLYVTDSGANHEPGSFDPNRPHHIKAFDVLDDGRLAGGRVFAEIEPGFPDGIKVDAAGRVYASSFSGVQVFAPDGSRIGEIELPGAVNFCFGGPERNVLFITADTAIYATNLPGKEPEKWPWSGHAGSSTTPVPRR